MSGLLGRSAIGGHSSLGTAAWLLARHADERVRSASLASATVAVSALPARANAGVWEGDGVLVALHGTAYTGEVASTPAELAQTYLAAGPGMLERLHGAFALAIVVDRPERRETLIATDRLGVEAMCFAAGGDSLAFGTRADAVAALAGIDSIDTQSLHDYLYFHMVPAPRTIFSGVARLLPGSYARWHDSRLDIGSYWKPRFVEDDSMPLPQLVPVFRQALQAGVARAVGGDDAVGCFLSGGTDSSTVAGMLGRTIGRPAPTFSIGFDTLGYDEMSYARIAARHFATAHHEHYLSADDVVDAVERIAAAHDQPFGNASVLPAYYCARQAREHGVARMLAGDGGDELYGGNERYATQYIFSLYQRVPSPVRAALLEPLMNALPAAGVLRKAKGYVRQANLPLPQRLQNYNLLDRLGRAQVLDAGFFAGIDADEPLQLLREAYDGAQAHSQINRLLALDLRFTLADNDLPKVNRACELAGVQVAYPLLDSQVVDFSLRLRPELKLRRTQLRWFFKHALRDFLPREVIAKRKHGFGLPFGPWLRRHPRLCELATDTLASLRQRRIVAAPLLDDLLSTRIEEHAGYYGTMIWLLMTLELWLARPRLHRPPTAASPRANLPLAT